MDGQREAAPEPEEALEHPALRALLVDDDPLIVALLQHFLRSKGYEVASAPDGATALARLRDDPGFQLVITDRHMPGLDGLALARAIRKLPATGYVYCVMLTSTSDEQSLVQAMEAGVDDFLGKPVRLPELGARLRAAERVLALEAGLASRNRQLGEAYGQLSRELELARTVQLGQLPPPGEFGRLRFDWVFEASSFVGGDVLDYMALDERHVCFYLADVSGHGVAAAMMGFNAQAQLRAASQQIAPTLLREPGRLAQAAIAVVDDYNRRFLEMKESSLYLTLLYGLADLETGRVALVQAGHPPPLLAPAPGQAFAPVGSGGLPVGILPVPGYEANLIHLPRGARLVLYSDGVTDCCNAAGEAWGQERLRAVLQRRHGDPLAASGREVHEALRSWRAAPAFEDDVTFLALEVR